MSQITVAVNGALGRMGQQVMSAVIADPSFSLTCAADIKADKEYIVLPGHTQKIPLHSNLTALIELYHPDVVVDFTVAGAAINSARLALKNGSNMVIGTTGVTAAEIKEIGELAIRYQKGAIVAANFSIGAVILIHLAKIAAKYFDNAEIIELHHDKKIDAPSGTALATADAMLKARGRPFIIPPTEKETLKGTRGGQKDGISIHSVRVPGMVASQEVIFGALGQTLVLRHDTINRESFMPGVMLAIKEVVKRRGLVVGLETLLDLGD